MKHPATELVFSYSQAPSYARKLLFILLVPTAPSAPHISVVSYSSMPSISAVRWLADTQSKPGHGTVAQLIRTWLKQKPVLTEFTPPRSVQPANATSVEKQLHFCYFFHAKTILFQGWRWKKENSSCLLGQVSYTQLHRGVFVYLFHLHQYESLSVT